jgi:hypothetical protein
VIYGTPLTTVEELNQGDKKRRALLWASLPLRPLLNHTAALADGVATAWPVLDCCGKHFARLVDTIAGVQQPLSTR